jgi:hypothetical protein
MIIIQRNGTTMTITTTKHLNPNLKILKVLLCFDYQNGITYEEENMTFPSELELFPIGIIGHFKKLWM